MLIFATVGTGAFGAGSVRGVTVGAGRGVTVTVGAGRGVTVTVGAARGVTGDTAAGDRMRGHRGICSKSYANLTGIGGFAGAERHFRVAQPAKRRISRRVAHDATSSTSIPSM